MYKITILKPIKVYGKIKIIKKTELNKICHWYSYGLIFILKNEYQGDAKSKS